MEAKDYFTISVSILAILFNAAWGGYLIYVTKGLDSKLRYLSVELDQSIRRLDRARDAAIALHRAYIALLRYAEMAQAIGKPLEQVSEIYVERAADYSAYWAELRGLAFAIGDEELLQIINQELFNPANARRINEIAKARDVAEMDARGAFQKIHTRIAELLQLETDKRLNTVKGER